jgi:hypothetical protein
MRTFAEHAYCVYAAVWSPQHADIFATASGDCTLKVREVLGDSADERLGDLAIMMF